jgi:uncharacterized RDD family membrane protein YckC
MAVCPCCSSEIPAGTRWCTMCRASVTGSPEKLASPVRRLGGFVIDVAIPLFAILLVFGATGIRRGPLLGLLLLILYLSVAFVLYCSGTTPGKKIFALRVIKESGGECHLGSMLVREIVGKTISGAVFLLGYLWILFDRERQGWHDKLANTYVVQE